MSLGLESGGAAVNNVSFGHAMRVLVWALLRLRRQPDDPEVQHDFCRAMREAKVLLKERVRFSGVDEDAHWLGRMACEAAAVLPRRLPMSPLVKSIRRHISEIRNALRRAHAA